MAIEISTLANLGEFDIELGVANPRTSGVSAGEGAIGYATDNSRWVKVGSGDTNWEQIVLASNNGKIPSNIFPDLIIAGLRQGTRAELDAADPALESNEPAWETDTQVLRVGNVRYTVKKTTDTVFATPGDDIGEKITEASNLTPGGNILATGNRAQVVVMAGAYSLSADYTHSHEFVDVVSLTGRRDVRITGSNILFTANDIVVRGIDFSTTTDGFMALSDSNPLTVVENCNVGAYSTSYWTEDATTYRDCDGGSYSFGGSGTLSGTCEKCTGGVFAFGGAGTMSGTCANCTGKAFAFGGGDTMSGTCINCTAEDRSFAGDLGTLSGTCENCKAEGDSFGTGTLSGKLYYCRLTFGGFKTVATGGITRLCIDGNDAENNQG